MIEDGCNVQETCVIHSFPGVTVRLHRGAHIGHGAVIHGASIGANVLVGMNAVVMDRATIGAGSIVGALTFVPADMQIPERKVVVGNPAKILKDVSDAMLSWKTDGTRLYQELPARLHAGLRACEPLTEPPPDRQQRAAVYETWHERREGVDDARTSREKGTGPTRSG